MRHGIANAANGGSARGVSMGARLDQAVQSSFREDEPLSRRRGQRNGWLRPENGSWLLTYRIYTWDPEQRENKAQRVTVKIGPAPNPPTRKARNGELTEKQAERFAWDHYLARLDNATVKPFSTITLAQFWTQRFLPHLERKRKYATQSQYKSIWKVWIEPSIGDVRLFELKPDQVDKVISRVLSAGKSTETAGHVQKVISAVIEHARSLQQFTGENPAQLVELPERIPVRKPHAMTVEQCQQWLAAVEDLTADPKDRRSDARPMRTMSLLGICCSLGVSEQMGLQWRYVNLTETAVLVDGETLEPLSVAIREHSYHGRGGSLKHGHRRRIVPLPRVLVDALAAIQKQTQWSGPEDPVFAGISGKPIWPDNLAKRVLKPLAKNLKMPWLSWHVFRHTCATLTKSYSMIDVDRRALMGHADGNMTDRYTHEDFERMRSKLEIIAADVTKRPKVDEAETAALGGSRKIVQITSLRARTEDSDLELTREGLQAIENKRSAV